MLRTSDGHAAFYKPSLFAQSSLRPGRAGRTACFLGAMREALWWHRHLCNRKCSELSFKRL